MAVHYFPGNVRFIVINVTAMIDKYTCISEIRLFRNTFSAPAIELASVSTVFRTENRVGESVKRSTADVKCTFSP